MNENQYLKIRDIIFLYAASKQLYTADCGASQVIWGGIHE